MIYGESYDEYLGLDRLDLCECGSTIIPGEEYCPDCTDLLTVLVIPVEGGDGDENS